MDRDTEWRMENVDTMNSNLKPTTITLPDSPTKYENTQKVENEQDFEFKKSFIFECSFSNVARDKTDHVASVFSIAKRRTLDFLQDTVSLSVVY